MQDHDITDRYMLARSAMRGTADMLADTHLAQAAILATLLDDTLELNDFERHGLLVAMQCLNRGICDHANHLSRSLTGEATS